MTVVSKLQQIKRVYCKNCDFYKTRDNVIEGKVECDLFEHNRGPVGFWAHLIKESGALP